MGEHTPLLLRPAARSRNEGRDVDLFLDAAAVNKEKQHRNNKSNDDDKVDRRLFRSLSLQLNKARNAIAALKATTARQLDPSTASRDEASTSSSTERYNYTTNNCKFSFGTQPHNSVWLNVQDQVGCVVAILVWILFVYSMLTVMLLAEHHHMAQISAALYCTITALALASHAKTTLTDPGTIPSTAAPPHTAAPQPQDFHSICAECRTYKPARTHHCRICRRCIAGMDHHCPWMNSAYDTRVVLMRVFVSCFFSLGAL